MTGTGPGKGQNRDESGSALVLALLVVLVVGSGLAVALDYVGTGFTLAPNVRDNRNASNYAQGAVEGAINQIRGGTEAGRPDTACPTFTPDVPGGLQGVSGKVFSVTCTGLDPGSGVAADQPRFAIHALGTGPQGIRLVAGNDQLYIDGGIYSKGVVSVGGGNVNSLRVNGTILAEGACTGKMTQTDPRPLSETCGSAASAAGVDPGYISSIADDASLGSLIGSVPLTAGADPLPTCSGGSILFRPGYYQQSPASMVASFLSSCSATWWRFEPGRYYFDYPGKWTVKDYKVVAGTPSTTPTTLGAACNPEEDGVQFIFGGSSQVETQGSSGPGTGQIELCGPSPAQAASTGTQQRISIYGVTNGAAPASQTTALKATTGPSSTPATSFLAPALARTLDGIPAIATFDKESSATLDYGALPASALPKGARVTSATLRYRHTVSDASAQLRLSVPGAVTVTINPPDNCSAICTTTLDQSLFPKDVLWRSLSQLSVAYVLTPSDKKKAAPAASVDGLEVSVTYTAPKLNKLDCGCPAFFTSTTNPNVFLRGTVYTPTSDWAVTIHNNGETIFARGIVMRDIAITMNSSSKQETSPFQLPRGTPNGRLVLFRGYVDGVETVRACARYVDHVSVGGGRTAAYAGWSLTVPRWLAMRTPSGQPATCT